MSYRLTERSVKILGACKMRNCRNKMYGNPSDDLCNAQNKHMIRLVVFNHKDKCICVSIKGTASREKYCVLQYDVLL